MIVGVAIGNPKQHNLHIKELACMHEKLFTCSVYSQENDHSNHTQSVM